MKSKTPKARKCGRGCRKTISEDMIHEAFEIFKVRTKFNRASGRIRGLGFAA